MSTAAHLPSAPELSQSFQNETNATVSEPSSSAANQQAQSSVDSADMSNNETKPRESATAYSFSGDKLRNESSMKKDTPPEGKNASDEEKIDDSMYECNICLDTAKDAVVSFCGHLFCWPCLHQWLQTRPHRKLCPVCKAAIDKDKVIPLYGRNSTKQEDPRKKVPPRPAGQRTEPEPQGVFQGFGFGENYHMSFGIGAFPFGYFASSFNLGDRGANRGTAQNENDNSMSQLFLYLAFLCIAWLLFA